MCEMLSAAGGAEPLHDNGRNRKAKGSRRRPHRGYLFEGPFRFVFPELGNLCSELQALSDPEVQGLFGALRDLCDPFCSMAQWLAAGPKVCSRSASHVLGQPMFTGVLHLSKRTKQKNGLCTGTRSSAIVQSMESR